MRLSLKYFLQSLFSLTDGKNSGIWANRSTSSGALRGHPPGRLKHPMRAHSSAPWRDLLSFDLRGRPFGPIGRPAWADDDGRQEQHEVSVSKLLSDSVVWRHWKKWFDKPLLPKCFNVKIYS